jgi:rhamnulokinase
MSTHRFLAFDIGAESGRAFVGALDDDGLDFEEIYRFPNEPVHVHGTIYWDVLALYHHLLLGMHSYVERFGPAVDGIGIDTWGVDFGLLDAEGKLLQNPVHHRDHRTDGMVEVLDRLIPLSEVFSRTGMGPSPVTSSCQLLSLRQHHEHVLDDAATFLMMPDLLAYFLTGVMRCERTNAVTTQLYDGHAEQWCDDIIAQLGLPRTIFPPLVNPGTILGELDEDARRQSDLQTGLVIAPCSHDSAAAVSAVPGAGPGVAFISSGTWSVLGTCTPQICVTPEAFTAGIANELAFRSKFIACNIIGLWLLQQVRAAWQHQGMSYSYAELVAMAEAAPAGGPLIDAASTQFLAPLEMPQRIADYCRQTGQRAPETPGAYVRCILESLALTYRQGLDRFTQVLGQDFHVVHVVGGGSRNALLCRFTAGATGHPVVAGPVEATVRGNILTQAAALGYLTSPEEIRERVRQSTTLDHYTPTEQSYWEDRYASFLRLQEVTV